MNPQEKNLLKYLKENNMKKAYLVHIQSESSENYYKLFSGKPTAEQLKAIQKEIHVIEYSAYADLKAELNTYKNNDHEEYLTPLENELLTKNKSLLSIIRKQNEALKLCIEVMQELKGIQPMTIVNKYDKAHQTLSTVADELNKLGLG